MSKKKGTKAGSNHKFNSYVVDFSPPKYVPVKKKDPWSF